MMNHSIQHNPTYNIEAKILRPVFEHLSYFCVCVCVVMVGFCLKVSVILSVILHMTVIFLSDILSTINHKFKGDSDSLSESL